MNLLIRLRNLFNPGSKQVINQEHSLKRKETGFIKFFNRSRGYGFIRLKEMDTKVFFHITEVDGHFRVGDRVKFDLGRNPKGLVAKNVESVKA